MTSTTQTYTGEPLAEAAVVGAYATAAADPTPLDEERRFWLVNSISGSKVIDLDAERNKHAEFPRRKAGAYTVHDADSFVAYLSKHASDDTEVWANLDQRQVTAVLDAHGAALPGWEEHRLTLKVRHTPAWNAWASLDGRLVDQGAFAEHIEDRLVDIVRPSGADMLELAQSIEATIGVRFESSKALSSGQREFTYKEQVDARAGRTGQLAIPRDFELGLAPFEGGPAYKVTARFRYRISDGSLRLGFKLDRPEDVVRNAFLDVVTAISDGLTAEDVTAPILMGVG